MKKSSTNTNEKKLKYISFDLDNTLISKKFDEIIWFREIPHLYARKHGLMHEEARIQVEKEYATMESRPEWTDIGFWFKHFKLQEDWKKVMDEVAHEITIFDDTISCLSALQKQYQLVLISAANKKFLDLKIKKEKIKPYFTHIFSTTSDLGCVDKKPETYKKILQKLQCSPNEIIHIGDSIGPDYLNPRKVGIRAFVLDRENCHKKDKRIKTKTDILPSLTELPKNVYRCSLPSRP